MLPLDDASAAQVVLSTPRYRLPYMACTMGTRLLPLVAQVGNSPSTTTVSFVGGSTSSAGGAPVYRKEWVWPPAGR